MDLTKHTQNIHEAVSSLIQKAADSAHFPSFKNEFSRQKNLNKSGIPPSVEGIQYSGEKHVKADPKFEIFEV